MTKSETENSLPEEKESKSPKSKPKKEIKENTKKKGTEEKTTKENAYFVLCSKQYFGEVGTILYTDYIKAKEGDSVFTDKVMVINDHFGRPYIPNAKIEFKVLKQGKKKKVYLVKFISQKRHKRWKNYRTLYTKLELTKISWQR